MDFLRKILDSANARVGREKARISFNEMRSKAEAIYKAQIAESHRTKSTKKAQISQNLTAQIFHKLTAHKAYLDTHRS
ncbi:hypothetical protein ACWIUD_02045 [Helicobacter sp. 23-1044]